MMGGSVTRELTDVDSWGDYKIFEKLEDDYDGRTRKKHRKLMLSMLFLVGVFITDLILMAIRQAVETYS